MEKAGQYPLRRAALNVATALASLGAPWLLGIAQNKTARNTFLAIGATLLAAGLLTERQQMPKYRELGE